MKHLLIISFFFATHFSMAQNSSESSGETRAERNAEFRKRPLKERMAYGGELSMYFSTVSVIYLSPFAGYRLNPEITMGVGPIYQYLSVRNSNTIGNNSVYRDHIFGGRAFIRHEIGRMFFAHAEYEILNFKMYNQLTGLYGRSSLDLASLGLGYKSSFGGEFGYYYLMVLFDFIQNVNVRNVYPTAPLIFKAGIIFGK